MVQEIQGNEIWKSFKYNNRTYYASSLGNIKTSFGNILSKKFDKYGYVRVRLINDNSQNLDKRVLKLIHRLIYKAFYPNCENFNELTINHIDGIKTNNNIFNLELVTRADNNKHAFKTGLKNHKGSNHPMSKLKDSDILQIRKLYSNGNISQKEIGKLFNVGQSIISDIIRYKRWT